MKLNKLIFVIIILFSAATLAQWSVTGVTPTEREDNTSLVLSEISGFNMYCGATDGDYTDQTFYPGATLPDTTWIVSELSVGTHYCVFTTVDIDARESVYSNMITLVNEGKARPKPPMIAPNQVITVVTTVTQ